MDRNMKAELQSLRDEVLANLGNIKDLVGKIDTRLDAEEEVSCLTRCPKLADLLKICQEVSLHPGTDPNQERKFRDLSTQIQRKMSDIAVDRYQQGMAQVLQVVNALDAKLGKVRGEGEIERYWEEQFPGVRDTVEQFLEDNGAVKAPKPAADDEEVREILAIAQRMNTAKTEQPDPEPEAEAPAWARDVESKSSRQIWQEAAEWDEDAQMLFGGMWNSQAERRISILKQVLAAVGEQVQGYNYYNDTVRIKNRDDLARLTRRYDDLETAKARVISVLCEWNRNELDAIARDRDRQDNWQRYYTWNRGLVAELERIAQEQPQGAQVASSCMSLLKVLAAEREPEVFDPMELDPVTFNFRAMAMPAARLALYRQRAQAQYQRDLEQAYRWAHSSPAAQS